ncbi:hypothetical protein [Comamonas serinivorans]|uniref:hypothetical protein n=1 Tax=Comamonas serinivorans TaxID=1082851 RepID=UPI00146C02DC|nr:hypothetical protein [Comamonas serinivorans]
MNSPLRPLSHPSPASEHAGAGRPRAKRLAAGLAAGATALALAGCQSAGAERFEGSTWHLSYDTPGYKGSYDITFAADGVLRSNNPHDNTPDNDRWTRNGEQVQITFNDGFATFDGRLVTPGQIQGTAQSASAGTWTWQAVRKHN